MPPSREHRYYIHFFVGFKDMRLIRTSGAEDPHILLCFDPLFLAEI